jgi:hypothetical protein
MHRGGVVSPEVLHQEEAWLGDKEVTRQPHTCQPVHVQFQLLKGRVA